MSDESAVRQLYRRLLQAWNDQDAAAMSGAFADNGSMVGFDGSNLNGSAAIFAHLQPILSTMPTPSFIASVREVRRLGEGVLLLRAAAGMIPRGKGNINPALNAIQTLVAVREAGEWRVAMFQNTPAAFHERPEASDALSEELRAAIKAGGLAAIVAAV